MAIIIYALSVINSIHLTKQATRYSQHLRQHLATKLSVPLLALLYWSYVNNKSTVIIAIATLRIKVNKSRKDPNAIDPADLINLGRLLIIGLSGYPS